MAKLVKKEKTEALDFMPTLLRAASLAQDYKAKDLRAYDVQGLTVLTDCFLMCTASSERQLKAVASGIRDGMKEVGISAKTVEGDSASQWILLDFDLVIVHLFREEAREFYDLDGLWADAKPVELDLDD